MRRVRGSGKRSAKPQLGFRRIHNGEQPVPGWFQLAFNVVLEPKFVNYQTEHSNFCNEITQSVTHLESDALAVRKRHRLLGVAADVMQTAEKVRYLAEDDGKTASQTSGRRCHGDAILVRIAGPAARIVVGGSTQ